MAKYIVQKAVGPDKVKKKLQRSMVEYEQEFVAQPKLDGCCAVMVLPPPDMSFSIGDGPAQPMLPMVMSRTGEVYVSLNREAREFHYKYRRECDEFNGLVLLGEAWNPNLPFNEISGLFRRGEETNELLFMVFDVLTLEEFNAGHSPVGWLERINRLTSDGAGDDTIAYFVPEEYGTVSQFLKQQLALGGRDGIILRDPKGTWTAGSGTTGEIIKIKQSLSFDLRVVGIEGGKGKHQGRMGALIVDFGGKQLRVGTGFTDSQREAWWKNSAYGHPWGVANAIVEVEAMDYSSDGLLREPRFKGIRHDKLEPDAIAA